MTGAGVLVEGWPLASSPGLCLAERGCVAARAELKALVSQAWCTHGHCCPGCLPRRWSSII
eukprot:scaffold313714_cov17-Tisochrysis_lutea.AAC.2